MLKLIDYIEAVSFDLDGTLVDTAPDLGAAANMMLVILGGRPLPDERIPTLIGGGIDELVARALEQSGMTPDSALRVLAAALFRNLYSQRVFERSRVYPGVVETLHFLRGSGRVLCCVTNKESRFALPLLRSAGLSGFFQAVLCADRLEDRKPSPNLLSAACIHAGVAPQRMLYVGDSHADILAAHAAGCRAVAVEYGYHQQLSFEELRPDGIVRHMEQIMDLGVRPIIDPMRAIA